MTGQGRAHAQANAAWAFARLQIYDEHLLAAFGDASAAGLWEASCQDWVAERRGDDGLNTLKAPRLTQKEFL